MSLVSLISFQIWMYAQIRRQCSWKGTQEFNKFHCDVESTKTFVVTLSQSSLLVIRVFMKEKSDKKINSNHMRFLAKQIFEHQNCGATNTYQSKEIICIVIIKRKQRKHTCSRFFNSNNNKVWKPFGFSFIFFCLVFKDVLWEGISWESKVKMQALMQCCYQIRN